MTVDARTRRLRKAAHYGKICGGCGRKLCAGEPVWRSQTKTGMGMFGGSYSTLAPFCAKCRRDYWDVWSVGECETCGRPVHNTDRRWRLWSYCCDDCQRRHQSPYRAAIARQRRAEARGPSRPCAACGEPFEPRRADAQFCSVACKQKAYRRRVTLSKSIAGSTFDSRNAAGRAA
jgi:hypothetical protein